jgi:hypothetical protein
MGHALGLPHALEDGALMSSVMIVNDLTHVDTRFARAVYASPECRRPAEAIASATRPAAGRGMY